MEVFLVQDYLTKFIDIANNSVKREVCGVVVNIKGKEELFICKNISSDNYSFIMDPVDYMVATNKGILAYVIHSHLGLSAEPTMADIHSCNKLGVPWIIYAVESKIVNIFNPNKYTIPLIGREYHFGTTDCWSLVTDIYMQELNISVGRPLITKDSWFEEGINYFEDYANENNFVKVSTTSLNKYDVILFKANNSKVPNHSAIYMGDNYIVHHVYNRLSTKERLSGYWLSTVHSVYRHKELLC